MTIGALLAAAALFDVRSGHIGRLTLALALLAVALSLVPLVRAATAIPRLDRAMRSALGDHFSDRLPATVQAAMRPAPIVIRRSFSRPPGPRSADHVVNRVRRTRRLPAAN